MFNFQKSWSLCLVVLWLSACASTPDPAKICTAQWIKPRTEKAVAAIEHDTKTVMKNLRRYASAIIDGKTHDPVQFYKLKRSIDALEDELKQGRGMRDLKMLAQTCDDPELISKALTDYMRDEGLPDGLIQFIKALPLYEEIIDQEFQSQSF